MNTYHVVETLQVSRDDAGFKHEKSVVCVINQDDFVFGVWDHTPNNLDVAKEYARKLSSKMGVPGFAKRLYHGRLLAG